MKRILAIVMFVLIGCGGIVFAGQNSNSSTTMEPNHNRGNMHGRRGHRYNRRWHRRHRRHGHRHMNKNANMG
jgi:hypothetical protein